MDASLKEVLIHAALETLEISLLIFIALVAMDLVYVRTRGKLATFLTSRPGTQYLVSGLLGAIPGCEGVYFGISLHTHGLISLGALLAAFIATTGDEAYVMFATMPEQALALTGILLVAGLVVGWTVDRIRAKRSGTAFHLHCDEEILHKGSEMSFSHYFTEHLWNHLIRKHMFKIVAWTGAAIILIELSLQYWDLRGLIEGHPLLLLGLASLVGLIPQSGPNLIFVAMYAESAIPFSIFFTNMFVQSGHALLPLLSISLRDSMYIKVIAWGAGIISGGALLALGV